MQIVLGENKSYSKYVCSDVFCPGFMLSLGQIHHKQKSSGYKIVSKQVTKIVGSYILYQGSALLTYAHLWFTKDCCQLMECC